MTDAAAAPGGIFSISGRQWLILLMVQLANMLFGMTITLANLVLPEVRGTLSAFVDGANVAVSGQPPTFTLDATAVEDESLKPIQFIAPGLLGWAVAMGATFNAAMLMFGNPVSGGQSYLDASGLMVL